MPTYENDEFCMIMSKFPIFGLTDFLMVGNKYAAGCGFGMNSGKNYPPL